MKRFWIHLIAASIAVAAFATLLTASPSVECEYTYFSDASKTTMVGWRGVYCTYSRWWGQTTPYYIKECFNSCDSPPDPGGCGYERIPGSSQCSDGIDNDCDGFTDSYDGGCRS
ncbi:MAG TPA: hypothetical protein VEO54_06050 [Thermoanaerobaculia bacterium]|nr:hypothetical protein [Thermoanaerobaculia bacterium]